MHNCDRLKDYGKALSFTKLTRALLFVATIKCQNDKSFSSFPTSCVKVMNQKED